MARIIGVGNGGSDTSDYNKNILPIITVGFDDGNASDLEICSPILQRNGIRATSFVVADFVENPLFEGKMTKAQILEYYKEGHEIGCHTYTHPAIFNSLSEEQVIQEFRLNKLFLEEIINDRVLTHAYPRGSHNPMVANIAGSFYEAARNFGHASQLSPETGYAMPLGHKSMYTIPSASIDSLEPAKIIEMIDDFIAWSKLNGGGMLNVYFHRIYRDDEPDKPENRRTESQFREVIEYLGGLKMNRKIDIMPFYEACRLIRSYQNNNLSSMPQYAE